MMMGTGLLDFVEPVFGGNALGFGIEADEDCFILYI